MKKVNDISKTIEVKNGSLEIIQPQYEVICMYDPTFYKFLAKLLIEDKKMQLKK
ncbi:MAG: hypothetical protein ACK4M9_01730 [Anaerobacillus sp.]|uniref:hypothetical protein n=1 Tax=Anaerobacillus sp. TaxID=1872506 RepID=UPI00391D5891